MKKRKAAYFKALNILLCVAFLAGPVRAAEPNDPLYKDQWFLGAIGMPEAWNFAKGSPTVRVAVLDTGFDLAHPDLKDRWWKNKSEIPDDGIDNDRNGYVDDVRGWDFIGNDNDPSPDLADPAQLEGIHHGTLVSGVIGAAGDNAEGITGVNWNLQLIPLRVLDSAGSGRAATVEAAIRYAVAQKADVINISFAGPGYSATLAEALRAAARAGVIIVAAAGNEGDTARGGNLNVYPEYPICYRGAAGEPILIGVSSLDVQDHRSSFSSYGSDCVTVSAPGENITTTQVYRPGMKGFREPYGAGWSGSSLAAPLVSGLAALLRSVNPALTPAEIRSIITAHAVPIDALNGGYAGELGAGRINASASVQAAFAALLGAPAPTAPSVPSSTPSSGGQLVKSAAFSSVYYRTADGKRYVFPNAKTYATWFGGFASVKTINAAELASLPLAGSVTYRPGTRLLKLVTQPEVYAVAAGGVLRHLVSEDIAAALYGPNWRFQVDDLPDAFFANYRLGAPITDPGDYDVSGALAASPTIEADRGLPGER